MSIWKKYNQDWVLIHIGIKSSCWRKGKIFHFLAVRIPYYVFTVTPLPNTSTLFLRYPLLSPRYSLKGAFCHRVFPWFLRMFHHFLVHCFSIPPCALITAPWFIAWIYVSLCLSLLEGEAHKDWDASYLNPYS